MTFYADKPELLDGAILLYRRQSPSGEVHPVWQMRLKLVGKTGYRTLSCKTKNHDDARALAREEFFKLQYRAQRRAFRSTTGRLRDTGKTGLIVKFAKSLERKQKELARKPISPATSAPTSATNVSARSRPTSQTAIGVGGSATGGGPKARGSQLQSQAKVKDGGHLETQPRTRRC